MTKQQSTFAAQTEQWRLEQDERIRRDYLTLVGLSWIEEGANQVGSHPSNTVVLPQTTPPHIGRLELHDGVVRWIPHPEALVMINGEAASERVLRSDASDAADLISVGTLTLWVIERGKRIGVRARDADNGRARDFTGRRWFPVDEHYRIAARFVPYESPKTIPITNILGDTDDDSSPGYAVFTLNGQDYRLEATGTPDSLFFHFRDATNGKQTYGGGRVLRAAVDEDGTLVLDFNRAVNLPCAWSNHTTCPTPPASNRLSVAVLAGELRPGVEL